MKKFFVLFGIFFFIASLFGRAYAQQNLELYLDPSTQNFSDGQTKQTKIVLKVPADKNIVSFNIQISYNRQIFHIEDNIENKTDFNRDGKNSWDNNTGLLTYARVNSSDKRVSGEITLGTITFKAQKTGSSDIKFEKSNIADEDSGVLNIFPREASYTVGQSGGQPPGSAPAGGGGSRTSGGGRPGESSGIAAPNIGNTDTTGCKPTDLGCIPSDPIGFVAKFYGIGLSLIGGIALLFIMYGGYLIMTSQGNPIQLSNGRSYILYAIIGLLLAIFGYVFVQIVVIDILHVPGFS